MRDGEVELYDHARLRKQFGAFVENVGVENLIPGRVENELISESYRRILKETGRIVAHQWREQLAWLAL